MHHFLAKKAILGLCPALILVVLACQAPLMRSGGTASLQIGLQLASPLSGSQPTPAERAVFGALVQAQAGVGERLLHPDTRYISLSVSGGGLVNPITQSKTVAAGESSVAMTISGLNANLSYTVTVNAFDGPAGGLLSSATTTVTVQSGTNRVPLGMVPVSTTAANVGPDAFSWTVGAAAFQVYKIHLPVATAYTCKALLNGATAVAVEGLFGPDGKRVAGFVNAPGDAAWGSFVAPAVGDYYVALSGKPGNTVSVTLDIPFSFTLGGEIQVMDAIHIRDCKLPVIVDCTIPLVSASPNVTTWKVGTSVAVAGSRLTFSNPAGFDAQAGTAATSASCQVVDGVIGATRTLTIPLGTFKNFAYVASTGLVGNSGAFGQPFATLKQGIDVINTGVNDVGAVVVAEGGIITEGAVASISKNMIVVGGCAAGTAWWSRAAIGKRSSIVFPGSNYLYLATNTATNTLVSGLDLSRNSTVTTYSDVLVDIVSCNPVFYDCSMVIAHYVLETTATNAYVITANNSAVPTFRSCRIKMGTVILNSTANNSANVGGIEARNGAVLVSTVVNGGSLTWQGYSSGSLIFQVVGLDASNSTLGNFKIVNSTIFAGSIGSPDAAGLTLNCLSAKFGSGNNQTYIYNSAFLVDVQHSYDLARSVWGSETALFGAFSNCSVTDMPIVLTFGFGGTEIGPGDLNNANRENNVCFSNSAMNFANFAAADYRLTSGSPAAVRSGGAAPSGTLLPAAVQAAARYDIGGKDRLADAAVSIGAYEY